MSDPIERTLIEIAMDQNLRRDRITRRTVMRRMGRGVVAVGALSTVPGIMAACQPGEEGSSGPVAWLNWPEYMDLSEDETAFPSIDAFTEQSGRGGTKQGRQTLPGRRLTSRQGIGESGWLS